MASKPTLFLILNRIVFILSLLTFTAAAYPPEYDSLVARAVVDSLDIDQFKAFDKGLADLGGREYGTQSNSQAKQWLQNKLEDL